MLHIDGRHQPHDPEAAGRLMREHPFALLVSPGDPDPWFTHLPVLIDGPDARPTGLRMHISRANQHWRRFAEAPRATVVFQGPQSYVSPNTYAHSLKRAPTWNYAVVHAHGPVRILSDAADVDRIIDELAETNERGLPTQWHPGAYEPARRLALRPMIVAFELTIERLDVRFKLNQDDTVENRQSAIAGLHARPDAGAHGVAHLMQEALDATSRPK